MGNNFLLSVTILFIYLFIFFFHSTMFSHIIILSNLFVGDMIEMMFQLVRFLLETAYAWKLLGFFPDALFIKQRIFSATRLSSLGRSVTLVFDEKLKLDFDSIPSRYSNDSMKDSWFDLAFYNNLDYLLLVVKYNNKI